MEEFWGGGEISAAGKGYSDNAAGSRFSLGKLLRKSKLLWASAVEFDCMDGDEHWIWLESLIMSFKFPRVESPNWEAVEKADKEQEAGLWAK